MNFLSPYSQECNTSRDVWNPSVTCTLSCTGTPQKGMHLTLVLQTLEHVLKDILKGSRAGHAVNITEHRLPVQNEHRSRDLAIPATTWIFCWNSPSRVALHICVSSLCPVQGLDSLIFLSFIPLLWFFVALGLTQMSMLHGREDAALCNSFIAWLYFSCHGPVCLLHDSGLSNNHWENHALADKTKEMKN